MEGNRLNIELKDIRAVKNANIVLDGITVITGENGCGKSTISKLTYNLVKTAIEFEKIVEKEFDIYLRKMYHILNNITRELSYVISEEEYKRVRKLFSRTIRKSIQPGVLENYNLTIQAIEYLIGIFSNPEYRIEDHRNIKNRLERIKVILGDFVRTGKTRDNDITALLKGLKESVNIKFRESLDLKEIRPVSRLNNKLREEFSDPYFPKSFNLYEYEVPIIDWESKKLLQMHSVNKVAYIDTPMIVGLDTGDERSHWEDLNLRLSQKTTSKGLQQIDKIFKEDIIKGDIINEEAEFLSGSPLTYHRNDGEVFDLLECATGLKSFSILQLLYKNGFLNNKTLLIIDEPEVHLHPQWVVEYARLLVLLNKSLGVRFLLASHHPDMISAIKYISEKEQVSENLHFYLANKASGSFNYMYKDLGIEIEDIFSSFNIALERIDLYGTTK